MTRALFDRLARMEDLVPFVELADGLPTPVEKIDDRFWVMRDDKTSSRYGGNKVRKFEFLLPVAQRRGGPMITAGGIGSHHVLAAAIWGRHLGLDVEAVLYPQPVTDDVRHTQSELRRVGARVTLTPHRYLMPLTLGQRLAALAPRKPYLLWPGASTPLGALGYVSAGLELVASGIPEPDSVVVSLGSGGTCVGLALGLVLGGWRKAKVVAARAADITVTNMAVLGSMEAATAALLALGGWRPVPARLKIDTGWLGPGYGHPTEAGDAATRAAAGYGLAVEPTYTAKAFACALDRHNDGQRVVFVQTFAGAA
ncbi:MAG: L-cysteate sulfo-lyase [Actinomycetota bacterium]